MKIIKLTIFAVLLYSCGKKSSSHKVADTFLIEPEGSYSAKLVTYDLAYDSSFEGLATVSKVGDSFQVKIKYKSGPGGSHIQGLYSESFCTPFERLGPMLIPLDGDLSSLELGSEGFPSGPNYNYEIETSYSLMLANSNLHGKDINLNGRAIVIHSGNIPAACGVLTRMAFTPEDHEPEVQYRPHPPRTVTHGPEEAEPTVSEPTQGGFFGRLWHRLGRWWRRVWPLLNSSAKLG